VLRWGLPSEGFLSFGRAPGSSNFAGAFWLIYAVFYCRRRTTYTVRVSAKAEGKQVQFHIGRRADAQDPEPIYSNFVQASSTPEDFTISFGWYMMPPLAAPPAEGEVVEVPVEPAARIVLPLNIVRNVIALLQQQIIAHEENFSVIPEHPNKPPWMRKLEENE